MRNLALVGALLLVLAACGTDDGRRATDPAGDTPSPPSAVPAADGEVTGFGTVMDTGRPELCLGPVAESWPPQCRGVPIRGWDWSGHDGMFERSGDVRWGTFAVTGTFDGTTITVTRPPIPGALYDTVAPGPVENAQDLETDPPGGRRTETELSRIAEDLMDLPGALSSSGQRDRVLVDVVFDDGSLQAWADEAYGADLVRIASALKPAAAP